MPARSSSKAAATPAASAASPKTTPTASSAPKQSQPGYLPPLWVTRWMIITTLIVSWDAGWTLLPGARDSPHWLMSNLYAPYRNTYSKLDMFYSSDSTFAEVVGGVNAFGPSQTALNVAEICAQLVYLYLALSARSPLAAVVGLCVSVATAAKTILYFVMLYFYGWERMLVGTTQQRILLFLIPNGIWSACLRAQGRPAAR
jgi:hypothetical protein